MNKIIFVIALIIVCGVEIFLQQEKPMQKLFREINITNRKISIAAQEKLHFLSATEKKEFVTILLHEIKKEEHYFARMGFLNLLQRYKLVGTNDHEFVIPILLFIEKDTQAQLIKKILELMPGTKTNEMIIQAYKTNVITFAIAVIFLRENDESMTNLVSLERQKNPCDVGKIAKLAINEELKLFDELLLIHNDNAVEKKQVATIFLKALAENNLDESQVLRILKILNRIIPQEQIPQLLAIIEEYLENKRLLFAVVNACVALPYRTDNIGSKLKKLIENNETVNVELEIDALTALLRTDSYRDFATKIFIKRMRKNHNYAKLLLEKTTEDPQISQACLQWLEAEKEYVSPVITEYLSQKQHEPAFATFVAIADKIVFIENKYYLCLKILSALSKYENQKQHITKKFIQYLGETNIRPIIKCHIISHMRDMGIAKAAIPVLIKLHSQTSDTRVLVQTQMTLKELGYKQ